MKIISFLSTTLYLPEHEVTAFINTAPYRYKEYSIPKRNGTGTRQIAQPSSELKVLQALAITFRFRRLRNASSSGLTAPERCGFLRLRFFRGCRKRLCYVGSGLIQDPKGEYVRPSTWGFLTPGALALRKLSSRGNGNARIYLRHFTCPPHPAGVSSLRLANAAG